MKVVYYTQPWYLDTALPRAKAISKLTELHFILEVSPESWNSGLFDLPPMSLSDGPVPAKKLFSNHYPPALHAYWDSFSSFTLMVYNHPKSLHPRAWYNSLRAVNYIRRLNPDVFHLDDASLRLAPLLWRIGHVPLILSIHDPVPHTGEARWSARFARLLTDRHADHVIVQSNFCRDVLVSNSHFGLSNITVIPLGVLDIFRSWISEPIAKKHKTVLFLGRLSQYKGLDVLFEAAKIVSTKISDCVFIISGKPVPGFRLPDIPKLDRQNSMVVLSEYLPNSQVAELMQTANLVVCPYRDSTQSGVILTSYAFNKPVIGTNVGGLPEYIWHGKSGLVIPPGDALSLAEALVNLLSNDEQRVRMEHFIQYELGKMLDWNIIGQKTVGIYQSLIAEV